VAAAFHDARQASAVPCLAKGLGRDAGRLGHVLIVSEPFDKGAVLFSITRSHGDTGDRPPVGRRLVPHLKALGTLG
jgi:hypothetical protein